MLRGVRGATTVDANDERQILSRVSELLKAMSADNGIDTRDIAAVIFSSTPDLNTSFPAKAAREIGWLEVPLFGAQEIDIVDGIDKCIRVLILWNTDKAQGEIKHVYLRDASVLRQDLARHKNTE